MNHYLARMHGPVAGAAMTIKAGMLKAGDVLDIILMTGGRLAGNVVATSSETAEIETSEGKLSLRPWRWGEQAVARFPGDNLTWVVAEVTPTLQAA